MRCSNPMRLLVLMAGVLLLAGAVTGCASRRFVTGNLISDKSVRAPVVPPFGLVFTQFRAPLEFDAQSQQIDFGRRQGIAEAHYIFIPFLGIDFAWGDGSLQTAARNGGLKRITHADYDYFSVLTVYQKVTFNAYGD